MTAPGSPNPVTVETFRELPTFEGLTDTQLEAIVGLAHLEEIDVGAPVLSQGGPANDMRVVISGKCRLIVGLAGNRTQHLMTLTRGEVIGWSALLDQATWLASATALKPMTVLVLDGRKLRALCDSDHDIGYRLMRNLFADVAGRLQDTRLQLLDMYSHA